MTVSVLLPFHLVQWWEAEFNEGHLLPPFFKLPSIFHRRWPPSLSLWATWTGWRFCRTFRSKRAMSFPMIHKCFPLRINLWKDPSISLYSPFFSTSQRLSYFFLVLCTFELFPLSSSGTKLGMWCHLYPVFVTRSFPLFVFLSGHRCRFRWLLHSARLSLKISLISLHGTFGGYFFLFSDLPCTRGNSEDRFLRAASGSGFSLKKRPK